MRIFILVLMLVSITIPQANAGLFNSVHFVEPGSWAVGLEPDVTLSNADGAAMAVNVRYTSPISDNKNVNLLAGGGGGNKRFRAGGNVTFDLFPNTPKQIGIGLAAQGIYYSLTDGTQIDLQAIPYVHETYGDAKSIEVEPYFAVPIGMKFVNGRYDPTTAVTLGALFKGSENLRYVFEVGLAINRTDSYVAGGIAYYP
jgi:hypothetical protein